MLARTAMLGGIGRTCFVDLLGARPGFHGFVLALGMPLRVTFGDIVGTSL